MSSCVTRVCGRTIIMWDDSCLQENLIHSLEKELMKKNTILFIWLLKKDRGRTNHIIATFLHQDLFCTGLILHFSIMWHPDAPSVTQSWQKKQWAVKNVFLLTYSVNTMSGRLCHNCFFFLKEWNSSPCPFLWMAVCMWELARVPHSRCHT